MVRRLGPLETQFFGFIQMRERRTVSQGEIGRALGLTPTQERKLLSRLSQGRLIARVRRGVYLVPPRIPLGGTWSPDEVLALNALIDGYGGRYQICGPNAFNRYGWDEQVPARVYAYNDRLSGDRTVGSVVLTLIKVSGARLGSTVTIRTALGHSAVYSSRPRALMDAVYDWSRFNTLPRAYDWIRADLAAGYLTASDLVRVTLRHGDVGTIRRVGALLEREGVAPGLLKRLEQRLRPSTSFIPWIPRKPKHGRRDRRWGVVWNDQR